MGVLTELCLYIYDPGEGSIGSGVRPHMTPYDPTQPSKSGLKPSFPRTPHEISLRWLTNNNKTKKCSNPYKDCCVFWQLKSPFVRINFSSKSQQIINTE